MYAVGSFVISNRNSLVFYKYTSKNHPKWTLFTVQIPDRMNHGLIADERKRKTQIIRKQS